MQITHFIGIDKAYLPAGKAGFVTLTVVKWIDIFTRRNHKEKIIESLKFCQEHKELTIFAWVLIPSHIHYGCSC